MRLVLVVVALSSLPAAALEKGDVCTLKAPLLVTINRPEGKVETTLDPGTDVEVVVVGDEGRTRVSTGDAKGAVATRDLEAACAGTLQLCRLTKDLFVFEKNRSDSRSWKIKQGAPLSVLRTGKVWAHVRVDDLEGFAKADELLPRCPLVGNSGVVKETGEPAPTEEVERGEGPGVLLLPLLLEGAAPAGTADVLAETFFDRLAYYRPDAARLPMEGARQLNWKKHLQDSAARAKNAGLGYVVVGKLAVESVGDKGVLVVSLALVDTGSGATVKAVRARPTLDPDDPWAETMLGVLLPLMRTAPGARQPELPKPKRGTQGAVDGPALPVRTVANATPPPSPWFANPWGYVALGTAAAAGVGSGVVGALANADNTAANDTPPVNDERSALREQALVKSITSDSLAVVAGVAAVTTIVVFASRAGMAE